MKIEVQNLEIRKIYPFSQSGQELDSVYFDCRLLFIDDLFSDYFKFNKANRLIGLKFGRIRLIN
ncbi:hypothetical protein EGI15_09005 [Chryseobacterium cucumeris]|uniref:Uncharacterized protein n=1 Tax=Chryseobacterium cucumeris TaxID=1813611 RepID=A0ABX9X815_9FLAO|nr:hypothetical protein EGI15_09005 [Chryseobacterium cucumeris]